MKSRASLYKWYSKAVILKQEDPELFHTIAARTRNASEAHGLDEESGVASYLRECDRAGVDPRTIYSMPEEEPPEPGPMQLPHQTDTRTDAAVATGNGEPAPLLLNADLYGRDADHSAYLAVAEQVETRREKVPSLARQIALNHLADVAAQLGVSRQFERWQSHVNEAFGTAFLLTQAEDWSDLDRSRIEALIDACFAQTNAMREAVGSERVDRSDLSTWVSILLLGFVHEAEEWQPLIDYVESRGAFERVQSLQETYSMRGHEVVGVKDQETDAWVTLGHWAWRDGILLAVLEKAEVFGTQEAGAKRLHGDDRPFTSELYDADPQAYLATAAELMGTTSHRVPDVAKEFYWHLASQVLDKKTVEGYVKHLQDVFEAGFVITQSESWRELDGDRTVALIDKGVRTVIRERDTRDAESLIRDPEYRIRNTVLGMITLEHFPELVEYLDEQPSYQRVLSLGERLNPSLLAAVRRRNRKRLDAALMISWRIGIGIALLDLLGEMAPTTLEPL
jgi:hypothetical protein